MADKVETVNLSMYGEQKAVLHQVAKDSGLGSLSAAARYIITDWKRLRALENGERLRRRANGEAAH